MIDTSLLQQHSLGHMDQITEHIATICFFSSLNCTPEKFFFVYTLETSYVVALLKSHLEMD